VGEGKYFNKYWLELGYFFTEVSLSNKLNIQNMKIATISEEMATKSDGGTTSSKKNISIDAWKVILSLLITGVPVALINWFTFKDISIPNAEFDLNRLNKKYQSELVVNALSQESDSARIFSLNLLVKSGLLTDENELLSSFLNSKIKELKNVKPTTYFPKVDFKNAKLFEKETVTILNDSVAAKDLRILRLQKLLEEKG